MEPGIGSLSYSRARGDVTPIPYKPYFPPSESPKEFARLLAFTTLALYDACLVGNPAPSVQRQYDEMKNPRPGDLVLEISSRGRETWPGAALGHLRFVCKAKPRTAEELVEAEADGYFKMDSARGHGPYWLVDPIDGSQRTYWTNAHFIRIPPPPERVAAGPVVFTRQSLLGDLADAGFELKEK